MIRIVKVLVPTAVLALLLSETVLSLLCYVAACYLVPDVDGEVFLLYDFGIQRVGLVVLLLILGLYFADLYGDVRVRSPLLLVQQLCMVVGALMVLQALIGYWNPDWTLPKRIMLLGSVFLFVALFGCRLLFSFAISNAVGALRVMFLGSTSTAVQLAGLIERDAQFGLTHIGYVLMGQEAAPPAGKVLRPASLNEMLRLIDEAHPERIIVAQPEHMSPAWVDAFLELRFGGIRAEDSAELYEETFRRVCLSEVSPSQLIFGTAFDPQPSSLKLQSLYSIFITAALALFTLPLALLIAILIKATSRGPVLLREVRTGLHDQTITLYRFRWNDEQTGLATPIGRLLRVSYLDSLPRLYSVLRGDMSIVGPRAIRPEFSEALSDRVPVFRHRHKVRPGLTGWAQICGLQEDGIPDQLSQLEYDFYYVKNLSPTLDLFILIRSIKALLYGRSKIDC